MHIMDRRRSTVSNRSGLSSTTMISLVFLLGFLRPVVNVHQFQIEEATIAEIHRAFAEHKLTSRELVDFYIHQIDTLNPSLRAVIEINPDARSQAEEADREREERNRSGVGGALGGMHGIPVLLKDGIGTKDKLNTTAGSFALLGSKVARDAGVVERLRRAGAVILGKASMSEWYQVRSLEMPNGWCPRSGQGVNPYVPAGDPCGSSSGSAISVAANMVTVSLGTETDGSIICPADYNSVVAIKPTVGLTSRAGVIPITSRQDTIGPMARTVSDAVYLLDSIVGFDPRDSEATKGAAKFIPVGGYKQSLNKDGLKGKRLGVVRNPFLSLLNRSKAGPAFEDHLNTLRQHGAIVIDNLEIANVDIILNPYQSGEAVAMLAEFKLSINGYLKELITSPVRSLADIISFNLNKPVEEKIVEFGQELFIASELTNGIGEEEKNAVEVMEKLSRDGFEKLMVDNDLDALITPGSGASTVLAIGGYPGLTVPAGYDCDSMPFGILFGGLKGCEPTLIEIAYAFEQATMIRSITINGLSIREATVFDLQTAFRQNQLTSRQLVMFYMREIDRLNPILKGVIEINPDALYQADMADKERKANAAGSLFGLHGIPVLLKDSIATMDKLNTTAGSFALLGSVVPRDAGVVKKLRKSGAIILGKASLSEWADLRSLTAPSGWSARGGQGKNPYVLSATTCGSSSGSAISVASNMASVSLGTETDGSILCPASFNAVVGIKPTVGLTSRAGVIPVTLRQDTVGPICRTVSDAVYVLDAIVGFDYMDAKATREASKYIPPGGYKQFLKGDGLKGKRLGIVRFPFSSFNNDSVLQQAFDHHYETLRRKGAVLIDDLSIDNIDVILNSSSSGEATAVSAELKLSLNGYLKELVDSPVRSLADIIAFNQKFSDLEMTKEFGQNIFLAAQATNGIGDSEKKALSNLSRLSLYGFEKLMKENELDAMVTVGSGVSPVLAIGGFPGINVPAAYNSNGIPVGICFSGLKGYEPKLIEIAYGFEQATKIRKPPTFLP